MTFFNKKRGLIAALLAIFLAAGCATAPATKQQAPVTQVAAPLPPPSKESHEDCDPPDHWDKAIKWAQSFGTPPAGTASDARGYRSVDARTTGKKAAGRNVATSEGCTFTIDARGGWGTGR